MGDGKGAKNVPMSTQTRGLQLCRLLLEFHARYFCVCHMDFRLKERETARSLMSTGKIRNSKTKVSPKPEAHVCVCGFFLPFKGNEEYF